MMSGFAWGILTLLSYAACMTLMVKISTKLEKKASLSTNYGEPMPQERQPTVKERDLLLEGYQKAVNAASTDLPEGLFSPAFAEELRQGIELCNKLRIQRRLVFTPGSTAERKMGYGVTNAEQLESISETLTGTYQEKITDTATNAMVDNVYYSKAELKVWMSRVPAPLPENSRCGSCNTPLEVDCTGYHCPQCGTRYSAPEMKWVISDVQVLSSPVQSNPYVMVMVPVLCFLMLAPPILAFFAGNSPFLQAIVKAGNGFMWFLALAAICGTWYTGRKKKKADKNTKLPEFYRITFSSALLLKRLLWLRDLNPAGVQPIMSADTYRSWCRDYLHEGDYVLHCQPEFTDHSLVSAEQSNGNQSVKLTADLRLTVIDREHNVTHATRTVGMRLYRRLGEPPTYCKTPDLLQCGGCKRVISLDRQCACPHCGSGYDLADYDWKIAWVDCSMLMDWGGKTYGDETILN